MRALLFLTILLFTNPAMGYDIHITRRSEWSDDAGPRITLDEWKKVVAEDSEMRLDGYAEASASDGKTIRIEADGLAVWTKWTGHGRDGGMAWFYYSKASAGIIVKNPDKEILRKMSELAKRLGARLQGDEGEFYDSRGEVLK